MRPSGSQPGDMAAPSKPEPLTLRVRFVGWTRFLVFLITLMVVCQSATQVYEHWEPADANPVFYAATSFLQYLWPRLLLGAAIGVIFLVIALLSNLRPPWHDAG